MLREITIATQEPQFTVTSEREKCEVRDYPPLVVAETDIMGDREGAMSEGFRILAAYIFGGNQSETKIEMTAPVTLSPTDGERIPMVAPVTQTENSGYWTVRFVMPKGYSLASLPKPNDPRVILREIPASRWAVVKFSGLGRGGSIDHHTRELLRYVESEQLIPSGPATLARYDPPWTLWFMRRNEIMFPLEEVS